MPAGHTRRTLIRRRLEQWGDVTCSALAKELGVTIKTVQRDLDQLAELGEAVRVHGGAVAPRTVRTSRTDPLLRVGVVFPTRTSYYELVRRGVEVAAAALNLQLITGEYDYSDAVEAARLRQLSGLQIDGLLATLAYDSDSYLGLAELDVPTVLVERPFHQLGGMASVQPPALNRVDHVHSDHVAGTMLGLDHLFSLGHRRVHCAFERTPTSRGLVRAIGDVEAGNHLPHWGSVSMTTMDVREYVDVPDIVTELVARVANSEETALFLHTDYLGMAVQRRLAETGLRVPDDVSLLTYDDLRAGDQVVPISAVSPQREWVGRLSCEVLADRLRSRGQRTHDVRPSQRISLLPELALRGTTAPPDH